MRRDALLTALPGLPVSGVAAGLHVALALPHGADEAAVRAAAAERSVAVRTLGEHAIAPRAPALLLGYARHPAPALAHAARELRAVLP